MFNNPFDSFHKTVGKAKKEREQLDRLLTISTPGELALVALTGLVLLGFVAWLLFGTVARSVTIEGVLVEQDGQTVSHSSSLQAAVWLDREVAQQITAGMSAALAVDTANGEVRSLDGEVATVGAVHLSEGLAPFEDAAPVFLHRVNFALDESFDSGSLDGMECRIVIELGRQSPIAFFVRRQS